MDRVAADPGIRAIAALDDELRRGMYAFIRAAGRPVTRDEAAAAVGISRKLAAFHLDKLVEVGALQAHYGQPGGTRKVGRAPKVYQPSGADIQVSIPPRSHEMLAGILLDAVLAQHEGEEAAGLALRVAGQRGEALGAAERGQARPGRLGTERALTLISGLLERCGFEPARQAPGCVRLRNCPFHPLVGRAPEMVCGINQAFLAGVVAGLDAPTVEAALRPHRGECCVELRDRAEPP
jgi:predicted ArsR family transcriptional regulator